MKNASNHVRIRTLCLMLCALGFSDVLLAQDKHIGVSISGAKGLRVNAFCPGATR